MKTPKFGPQMGEDARKAALAAFDAMSDWRNDMQTSAERHGTKVFDRMTAAAKAMGWPAEAVEATKTQMMAATKMQMQMMDQVMDLWEEQIRSPNPAAAMQAMMSKMQSMSGAGFAGGMPSMPGLGNMPGLSGNAINPFVFWMQVGEQWQKNWMQMMQQWQNQMKK